MKVLKFGGTSVGCAQNIRRVINLINNYEKKIVVFSAMAGTTDLLQSASEHLKYGNTEKARFLFNSIIRKYSDTANELIKNRITIDTYYSFLEKTFDFREETPTKNQLLSKGEIITIVLIKNYLLDLHLKVTSIPALEIINLNHQGNPDYPTIEKNMQLFMEKHPSENLFITEGFICLNHEKEVDNLRRGGSDFTATIIGSVCQAEEIQIWSDIDGLHNNDPRYVSYTKCVKQLSYEEAEELAYFGAKVLHPTCIFPAKIKKIPIRLKNTMNPAAEGTYIYDFDKDNGIKAIAAKDGIVGIKIHSGRMLQAYGFLKNIFEIFEKYKTPVDMITTSEVSVSITIDNSTALEDITRELKELGTVDVFQEQTIICVVGNFKSEEKGIISDVLRSIKHIPIRMLSYGASENNLSLLVHEAYKKEVLRSLQINLFSNHEIFQVCV